MLYLAFKAAHLIFMVAWFAGLFYLPRLFVYHTQVTQKAEYERFLTMERRLFWVIIMPASVLVWLCGLAMIGLNFAWLKAGWLHAKLSFVLILLLFQGRCYWHYLQFYRSENVYTERYFRFYNELPTLVLIASIVLAVFKPW